MILSPLSHGGVPFARAALTRPRPLASAAGPPWTGRDSWQAATRDEGPPGRRATCSR